MAKAIGALTVGVVTRPFEFEGLRRQQVADEGIQRLNEHVDTLLAIPNERLHVICEEEITAENAFKMADDVLRMGVQSIAELVTVPGEINLDLADIQTIMRDAGPAWMAIGWGIGEHRALEAAQHAISNPLLAVSIDDARGMIDGARVVLFNITGGSDLKLSELREAAEVIQRKVDPEANIFGMVTDAKLDNEVKLTIIATGFDSRSPLQSIEEQLRQLLREMQLADSARAWDDEWCIFPTDDVTPVLHRPTQRRKIGIRPTIALRPPSMKPIQSREIGGFGEWVRKMDTNARRRAR